MTTAEVTEVPVGSLIDSSAAISGRGLKSAMYTCTKTNASDYVIFGDFTVVLQVLAQNVATGALDPGTLAAGGVLNRVDLTVGTGATRVTVWGY